MQAGVSTGSQFGRRSWLHWSCQVFSRRGGETEGHIHEAFRLSPRDNNAYRWLMFVGLAKLSIGADAEAVAWLLFLS
jgi:hypothetical protein